MKKISKYNIRKSFVEKAVVLAIAAVFIVSAFVPAIGSQSEGAQNLDSSEMIKVGVEESIGSTALSGYTDTMDNGNNVLSMSVYTIVGLVNIILNNPIANGIRDIFTGSDNSNDVVNIESSTNQIEDDQLTIDEQEIDAAKENLSDIDFRQEYMASWESFTANAYYCFDEATHIKKQPEPLKLMPLKICLDFNVNPTTLLVSQYDPIAEINRYLAEYSLSNMSYLASITICRKSCLGDQQPYIHSYWIPESSN